MDTQVQRDFPIDWEEDQYVSRREFFKFLTLASGGLAVGSVGMAGAPGGRRGHSIGPATFSLCARVLDSF